MNNAAGNVIVADPALFEKVFKCYFKSLHLYACTIVKNETVAEEMVQNVFYKLWEKKEQIPDTQSVAAYLYRAVHNESLNYLKHAKVKAAYHAYAVSNAIDHDAADPAAIKELEQKIEAALQELPEQCRTIFQLSRFEDMKYREIADTLGISVKTVESQMGKALKILRMKLVEFLPAILMLLYV